MKSRIVQSADNATATSLGDIANESAEVARGNKGEFTWMSVRLMLTVNGKEVEYRTFNKIKLQAERGVKVYIPKIWSVEVSDPKCKKYTLCYTLGTLTLLGL